MRSCADSKCSSVRQDYVRGTIGRNRNGIYDFPTERFMTVSCNLPLAFNHAVDAVVPRACVSKVSARLRGDREMVFAGDANAAHAGEKPFTNRAFGVMVEASDAS